VRWPARRWARWLTGAGITTVLGLPGIVLLIANAGPFVPIPAILGRPLPWLGLQVTAVLTLLAGAELIRARWHNRPFGGKTGDLRSVTRRAKTGTSGRTQPACARAAVDHQRTTL
jgi:hypothetical protein